MTLAVKSQYVNQIKITLNNYGIIYEERPYDCTSYIDIYAFQNNEWLCYLEQLYGIPRLVFHKKNETTSFELPLVWIQTIYSLLV